MYPLHNRFWNPITSIFSFSFFALKFSFNIEIKWKWKLLAVLFYFFIKDLMMQRFRSICSLSTFINRSLFFVSFDYVFVSICLPSFTGKREKEEIAFAYHRGNKMKLLILWTYEMEKIDFWLDKEGNFKDKSEISFISWAFNGNFLHFLSLQRSKKLH